MKDSWRRQPGIGKLRHPVPRHTILLAASTKRAPPKIDNIVPERPERPRVRRHCVVGEETTNHRPQASSLFGDWGVHAAP